MSPLYSYECDTCRLSFDRYNTIQNRSYNDCPECGKSVKKILSMPATAVDSQITDVNGCPIYYPKDSIQHYDRILKKTFYSKKEKAQYMKDNNMMMDGSSEPTWKDDRCGSMKDPSYRKEMENLKAPIK